jgi:uncharacterized protein YecE (DUF72 family)
LLGCSGWNYPESADKGGWTGVFYPDKDTKRLRYYSQFFDTAEMDSTFYEKFYSHMTKGTFIGMSSNPGEIPIFYKSAGNAYSRQATRYQKRSHDVFRGISGKNISLKNTEQFLDRLPTADRYDYAVEFRHPSWGTEGPWEMLKHYNIAAVRTDSPEKENLQYLSDVIVTTNHSLVRFHGRNTKGHYWYNYLYSEQELRPWVEKVDQIRKQTKVLRVYFNNHYGGKAVVNALQFKAMTGRSLSEMETNALKHAQKYLSNHGLITSSQS